MVVAGIDYSMSSPAVCIHSGSKWSIDNCEFFFLNSSKKFEGAFLNSSIHGKIHIDYSSEEERFDNISNWAMSIISTTNPSLVAFEGYSMSSVGKIFNIAENGGLLKHKLFKHGFAYTSIPPTTVKKFATSKGNAKKEDMQRCFVEETTIDIKSIMGISEKQWNPSSDIIDAYYICKMAFSICNAK